MKLNFSWAAIGFFIATTNAHAFVSFGTYPAPGGMNLRYVATGPLGSDTKKQETWIYQDGDGSILNDFSPYQNALFSRAISAANGIVFIWPELRREALSRDLKRYCELDYKHRIGDLNSLIDTAKQFPFVDPDRLVLVGFSGGSEIVTWTANQRNDIAAVVTVGGGVLQLADYIREAGDNPGILENVHSECKEGNYQNRSGNFWSQLLFSGFYQQIETTTVPYLAIVGQEDSITRDSVTRPNAEVIEAEHPNFQYVAVPKMEHGFGWLHPWRWNVVKEWTERVLKGAGGL